MTSDREDVESRATAADGGRKRTRNKVTVRPSKDGDGDDDDVAADPAAYSSKDGNDVKNELKGNSAAAADDDDDGQQQPAAADFEDLLTRIGNYGKYQKRVVYWFVYPQACFLPFFVMTIFLQMHVPDHWCSVPGREETNFTAEQWKNLTIPRKNKTGEFYKCSHFDISPLREEVEIRASQGRAAALTMAEAAEFRLKSTKKCEDWDFDTSQYTLTAPSDYKWVCDRRHYGTLALTIQNIGGVFSTLILGPLADIIGRKPVYFFTLGLQMVFGIAGLFAPEFYSFVVMTFLRALAFPSVWQSVFVLAMEIVGPQKRAMINGVLNLTWTLGVCALSLVAYLCKGHWVVLGLLGNIPLVVCFGYAWLVWESPRWLAQRNRLEESADILIKIAKQNGTTDKITSREKLIEELRGMREEGSKPLKVNFWHLFKRPKLRIRTLIITYGYTVIMILYYGLHLNIASLGGDPYLNFALLGFFEFPAYVFSWWAMDRYGRRWVNALNLLIAGVGCLCVAVTPKEHWLVVVWSILGKFGSSGGFVLIYQQGCEVFPTVLRSTGLGFMSLVGAAVNAGVPQLVFWGEVYHYSIPYVTFGIMSLLGVVFAAFLPETLNKDLPETVEDSERFGADQSFWAWNLTNKNNVDGGTGGNGDKPTSPTSSTSTTTAEAAALAAAGVTITKNPCFRSDDDDDEDEYADDGRTPAAGRGSSSDDDDDEVIVHKSDGYSGRIRLKANSAAPLDHRRPNNLHHGPQVVVTSSSYSPTPPPPSSWRNGVRRLSRGQYSDSSDGD